MAKKVNYKKASTFYLVGNIFNKGISFLTVPIFTRMLSTSDYGIVTTYNSWIAILAMIIGFAIHMGIRAAFIDYRDVIDDFMSVTITFTIEFGLCFGLVVILLCSLIKINVSLCLIILCLFQSMSSALIEDYSMYLMMQYQYKLRTALMVLPNLISAVLSIIAIELALNPTRLYLDRIIPTAIVYCIFAILICILVFSRSHVLKNHEYLKYGVKISAPLILHGIALNILSQSDRTMITWLANASQTGIYSLIYNFSMIATVITTSLDGVWVPWFTEQYKNNHIKKINVAAIDYVHLMTYAMVVLILAGPEIVHLLASEKYWEGIVIIPPVVLSNYFIFLYTLYVNVEHFHKKTTYITINTVIAAITNIVLNYIFIPLYGYVAAAYTTLASYLVALILHANYAKKLNTEIYPIKMFLPSLVHIAIASIIFYLLLNEGLMRWGIAFVYILCMAFLNRNKIVKIFPSIKVKLKK